MSEPRMCRDLRIDLLFHAHPWRIWDLKQFCRFGQPCCRNTKGQFPGFWECLCRFSTAWISHSSTSVKNMSHARARMKHTFYWHWSILDILNFCTYLHQVLYLQSHVSHNWHKKNTFKEWNVKVYQVIYRGCLSHRVITLFVDHFCAIFTFGINYLGVLLQYIQAAPYILLNLMCIHSALMLFFDA